MIIILLALFQPSLYQPKGAPGRLDSASPAQNLGFPAAYRSQMDISDPQAQQRLIQNIQQHMASINSASGTNSSGTGSFPTQGNHQIPNLHQQAALAAAQKQIQQQIHGPSQPLSSFAPSHYSYADGNATTPADATTPGESATTPNPAAEFATNPHIKIILAQAQKHAVKDLLGMSFPNNFKILTFVILEGITNRAINVSIPATECLCKKDFAMNPDNKQLRHATHQMMRSLSAAMTR